MSQGEFKKKKLTITGALPSSCVVVLCVQFPYLCPSFLTYRFSGPLIAQEHLFSVNNWKQGSH
jgi:hypothetical protein